MDEAGFPPSRMRMFCVRRRARPTRRCRDTSGEGSDYLSATVTLNGMPEPVPCLFTGRHALACMFQDQGIGMLAAILLRSAA
jgi:hypothetical protein